MAIKKLLIANRGEIALRVMRAAKELGIKTVAVHSEADTQAMHSLLADESVCIGPPSAKDSYLNFHHIIGACEITGATAVHPGYGFLSEKASFAEALNDHGISFIGPSPLHIKTMGDKIKAKQTIASLGIPTIRGSDGEVSNAQIAKEVAKEIGYPVLIKAAFGGGGKGMKVAHDPSELERFFLLAQHEAKAAFGDGTVYLEQYLSTPKHIEFQIFGDGKGKCIHLGERDCSTQRNHQKLIEEARAPNLSDSLRQKMGDLCAKAMGGIHYSGAGTIEFLYEDGEFYFLEMNTRIQVEHPITEEITGFDLVSAQLRLHHDETFEIDQSMINFDGHSIEIRINAENPFDFTPHPGKITMFHPPGGNGVRVDSAVFCSYTVPPYYDSLIGKLIVHAPTRDLAISKLKRAINEFVIDGIETTLPLYSQLLEHPSFKTGDYSIHWLEQYLEQIKT